MRYQLSAYLVQPNLAGKESRHWAGFSTRLLNVRRAQTRTTSRALVALAIWMVFVLAIQFIRAPQNAAASQQSLSAYDSASQAITPPSSTPVVALSKAAPAVAPSPISATAAMNEIYVAPYGTYANNYDPGQCTWYVATRRKVPSNWGNANTWYYMAGLAGWSEGSVPKVGAIAWTGAGYYGHVAIVTQVSGNDSQVQVSEMNYYGPYARDTRWSSTSSFKYIY
jgi:surface antigen